jgi:hypothetical protein
MADDNNNATTPASVWHHKPWWCQPWSIVLTTILLIGGSWLVFHQLWLTLLVAVSVGGWMVFFIGVYPKLWQQEMLRILQEQHQQSR